jgi:hypothetical protein
MRVLADGRVRRTESEWRAIVARYERSGMSELAFCRKAKLSRQVFRRWRRKRSECEAPGEVVEWVVPEVVGEESSSRGEFELTLPGGAVLRWKA